MFTPHLACTGSSDSQSIGVKVALERQKGQSLLAKNELNTKKTVKSFEMFTVWIFVTETLRFSGRNLAL